MPGQEPTRLGGLPGWRNVPAQRKAGSRLSTPLSQSFFVPGPLPGLNDFIAWAKKRGVTVGKKGAMWNDYNAQKRSWEDMIRGVIHTSRLTPVAVPVTISYLWQEPNKRRDYSNIAAGKKLVEDALVRAGILRGDGWRDITGFTDRFEINRKQPGVRVTLMPDKIER